MKSYLVWRKPPVETEDYPGLVVCDNRVTGSINVRASRLSLWAFIGEIVHAGFDLGISGWSHATKPEPEGYGYSAGELAEFLGCLLDQRGEFGRLICVLADVERRDYRKGSSRPAWYETKSQRRRVMRQLQRCLDALQVIDEQAA